MDRNKAEAVKRLLTQLESLEGFREALQDFEEGTPDTTTLTITNTLDGNSVSSTIRLPKHFEVQGILYDLDTTIMDIEGVLRNM